MSFSGVPAAALADACIRLGVSITVPPPGLRPVTPVESGLAPALLVHHRGSVDAMLEALEDARGGEVMVVDDAGRTDRACVGDLVVAEAKGAGIAALVVWGMHRDTAELLDLGLPVFSYGSMPVGPAGIDRPESATVRFGSEELQPGSWVAFDRDGVFFLDGGRAEEVVAEARSIAATEAAQRRMVEKGTSLRAQLRFSDYLAAREADPARTFRDHLQELGGAIET